jgi:hypothetical protein
MRQNQYPDKLAFQRLGLAYARERVALDLGDQAGDPGRHLAVCAKPVQEVFPRVQIEVDASQLLARQDPEFLHGLGDDLVRPIDVTRSDLIVVDDILMLPAGHEAAEAFYRITDARTPVSGCGCSN